MYQIFLEKTDLWKGVSQSIHESNRWSYGNSSEIYVTVSTVSFAISSVKYFEQKLSWDRVAWEDRSLLWEDFTSNTTPSHGGALVHCPAWENNRTAWQLPSSANEGNYNCRRTTLHAALLWHHPLPSLPFTRWIMSHYKVWLEFSVSQTRQVQKVLSSGCWRVKKVANWEEKLWRALW